MNRRSQLVALACSVLTILIVSGCGDDYGTRYKISGTVTYKGAPVPKGVINFDPVDPKSGRAATGEITEGKYYLTTFTDGDGAVPGDYKVRISARKADFGKAEANQQKTGGMARQDDIAKAYRTAEKLVPAKYELAETSGLTAKISKAETIDFPLAD